MGGDERIWWHRLNDDGRTWTGPQPLPGANSSVGPGGTNFAGPLTAWKGVDGDQDIWWSQRRDGQWRAPQKISGAATSFDPELGIRQYDLPGFEPVMLWKGDNDDQRLWRNPLNGSSYIG
ncbi:hypothetical protein AGRA3207_006368 [Actinomadura graeca]|uniref:Sialidase n=1 Tax=Actinomadura graeca TaxID=2750812 RepID=A0ABX8R3C6_9ACTN|nr:hypothetical protein [Actinomadura graeca]QXJ24949.1 hypothetical protein AGRA3207_006368 [Actinomadura graeca]